jgi:hypothetical protein
MFDIVAESDGGWRAASPHFRLRLLPDGAARMFRRRAIKAAGTPAARAVEWLVAELDGVRLYVDGSELVMTRRELQP